MGKDKKEVVVCSRCDRRVKVVKHNARRGWAACRCGAEYLINFEKYGIKQEAAQIT